MYSPNIFRDDFHHSWLQKSSSKMKNQENDPIDDSKRHLYAPPLSAYSVERPGANMMQLEYLMKTRSLVGGKIPGTGNLILTPSVNKRLQTFSKIRNHGFSTITPIGINKTMLDIQMEEAKQIDATQHIQLDNELSNQEDNNSDEEPNNNPMASIIDVTNNSILEQPEEVDLDAAITNLDSDNDQFDEGFMAEEVEYQDDHSITQDNRLISGNVTTESVLSVVQRVGNENNENNANNENNENNENMENDENDDSSFENVVYDDENNVENSNMINSQSFIEDSNTDNEDDIGNQTISEEDMMLE